jgi:predicted nuclease of predicted toxin-antitoxin system
MRLLLDQGLPRSTIAHLNKAAIESSHVGDRGLATASDMEILNVAYREGLIVVTLDADFHMLWRCRELTGHR